MKNVRRRELQLVGICSMLIAYKYEENIFQFQRQYNTSSILKLNTAIRINLEFNLNYLVLNSTYTCSLWDTLKRLYYPTVRLAVADGELSIFLAKLGLVQFVAVIKYRPLVIAAAAIMLHAHSIIQVTVV